MASTDTSLPALQRQYLDLLRNCLTRSAFPETTAPLRRPVTPTGIARRCFWAVEPLVRAALGRLGLTLTRVCAVDLARRSEGRDWPEDAETMIGCVRLDNLRYCVEDVVRRDVPGDLIEAGVWRGGAGIFMRAALNVYGDRERIVWLADSFEGLPKPSGRYAADRGSHYWQYNHLLAVSLEEVQNNFARYGLLDERVRFLKGWFRDSLPDAPIGPLALLRLDGDMYESTINVLDALYPKLSVGGYCIVDDYALDECRQAVTDYRTRHGITDLIQVVDWTGVFWQKSAMSVATRPTTPGPTGL